MLLREPDDGQLLAGELHHRGTATVCRDRPTTDDRAGAGDHRRSPASTTAGTPVASTTTVGPSPSSPFQDAPLDVLRRLPSTTASAPSSPWRAPVARRGGPRPSTRAPRSAAPSRTAWPMGPAPNTTTVSCAVMPLRAIACKPMDIGSTRAANSRRHVAVGYSSDALTARRSARAPSIWAPYVRIRRQQLPRPRRQGRHSPHISRGSTATRSTDARGPRVADRQRQHPARELVTLDIREMGVGMLAREQVDIRSADAHGLYGQQRIVRTGRRVRERPESPPVRVPLSPAAASDKPSRFRSRHRHTGMRHTAFRRSTRRHPTRGAAVNVAPSSCLPSTLRWCPHRALAGTTVCRYTIPPVLPLHACPVDASSPAPRRRHPAATVCHMPAQRSAAMAALGMAADRESDLWRGETRGRPADGHRSSRPSMRLGRAFANRVRRGARAARSSTVAWGKAIGWSVVERELAGQFGVSRTVVCGESGRGHLAAKRLCVEHGRGRPAGDYGRPCPVDAGRRPNRWALLLHASRRVPWIA